MCFTPHKEHKLSFDEDNYMKSIENIYIEAMKKGDLRLALQAKAVEARWILARKPQQSIDLRKASEDELKRIIEQTKLGLD